MSFSFRSTTGSDDLRRPNVKSRGDSGRPKRRARFQRRQRGERTHKCGGVRGVLVMGEMLGRRAGFCGGDLWGGVGVGWGGAGVWFSSPLKSGERGKTDYLLF